MTNLAFDDPRDGSRYALTARRLLVAGFTGRDAEAVDEHVDELAKLGVPVPDRTPSLYRLDPALLAQTEQLVVTGDQTSGETEPVLVVHDGRLLLTVGSDHTDRWLEREDIARSKAACGKVLGRTAIPLDAVADRDAVRLSSTIGQDDERYQDGTLAELRPIDELLTLLADTEDVTLRDGDVLFLGTVAALGGIRPSDRFRGRLELDDEVTLELAYDVVDVSSTGRAPMAKPEIEFTATESTAWTPVPGGVEGQTERILATDRTSGTATRMLRFEPGTDTSSLGIVRHDFWEEVYILEGELHDLTLDEVFPAGTYACRPPGMPHGPWKSEPGCVTFEVRYPAS